MNELFLPRLGSQESGYLSFLEVKKDIPFDIKRIYYTYDVPINTKRGMHAHKTIQQILWCPYGSIEVMLDDGVIKTSYLLKSPESVLIVNSGIWHEMYWRKEGAVLCAAASDYYDEEDYIRDYQEYLKYVKECYWKNEDKF